MTLAAEMRASHPLPHDSTGRNWRLHRACVAASSPVAPVPTLCLGEDDVARPCGTAVINHHLTCVRLLHVDGADPSSFEYDAPSHWPCWTGLPAWPPSVRR